MTKKLIKGKLLQFLIIMLGICFCMPARNKNTNSLDEANEKLNELKSAKLNFIFSKDADYVRFWGVIRDKKYWIKTNNLKHLWDVTIDDDSVRDTTYMILDKEFHDSLISNLCPIDNRKTLSLRKRCGDIEPREIACEIGYVNGGVIQLYFDLKSFLNEIYIFIGTKKFHFNLTERFYSYLITLLEPIIKEPECKCFDGYLFKEDIFSPHSDNLIKECPE